MLSKKLKGETKNTKLTDYIIHSKILPRLPMKSVMRFKSVSKSWLSLLSSSSFIREHSIHSPMQNPNDYDCLVVDKFNQITIVSRDKETTVLRKGYESLIGGRESLIGSVNGLVCILSSYMRISLWNPAIHQSMEFNLPQDKHPTLVGAAFDHVSNDCKVVVCYPLLASCAVYSSNSNSWIQLSVSDHEFFMNKLEEYSSYIPTTYVKDCPYWTYSTYSSDKDISPTYYPSKKNNFVKSMATLKFDATSMKFKLLSEFFPDAQSRERGKIFKFVNMRDLLSLLAYEPYSIGKLDVYSLDEEKGCGVWIKMHCIGPFEQFWQSGNLLQGFKYGDHEIIFFYYGKIHYYDHKTQTFKHLPGSHAHTLLDCFTYTPSMVSLKGMKSIYSDNQTLPLVPLCH